MDSNKKYKVITADYLNGFQCIGSACEDNCCVGWDVDIDKKTFMSYQKVKDEVLTRMFKKHVHQNHYSFSDEVDFGVVRLTTEKQCPFLDGERLCRIQARLGESYLSNVCHTFPRYTNVVDGVYEHTATASCPEIARRMLLRPEGIRFVEETAVLGRHIITNNVQTEKMGKISKSRKLTITHFKLLRSFSIELLQERSYPLGERILILGHFCWDVEALEKDRGAGRIQLEALCDLYRMQVKSGEMKGRLGERKGDKAAQMALLKEVADKLNVFSEVESASYVAFTRQFLSGIGHEKKGNPHDQATRYAKVAQTYYEPYMSSKSYILENFMVNFVFKNLFPYSETYSITEAYLMLVIRYALIQMNLTGLSGYHKGLKDALVVDYLQAFSKTVEHHRTYLDDMVTLLKKRKLSGLSHMALLL